MGKFNPFFAFSLVTTAKKELVTKNEHECAKLCLDEKDFVCRSFDLCQGTKPGENKCLLHVFHASANARQLREEKGSVPEVKFNTNDPDCTHFSRKDFIRTLLNVVLTFLSSSTGKYSVDFKRFQSSSFADKFPAATTRKGVIMEDCAEQCSSNEKGCKSFEYCERVQNKKLEQVCRTANELASEETNRATGQGLACSVFTMDEES